MILKAFFSLDHSVILSLVPAPFADMRAELAAYKVGV